MNDVEPLDAVRPLPGVGFEPAPAGAEGVQVREGRAGPSAPSTGQGRWAGKTIGERPTERQPRRDGSPVTTGLWIGEDGGVHVDVAPSRLTSGLAAFMTAMTLLPLAVMLAVRQDDPFAGVAIACALVVTAGVGAVVAARRPDHPCGWLLGALCVVAAIAIAGTDYVQPSLARPERYPWTVAVGWVTTWIAFPAVAMGALVLLTFPTGRLSSPRWRAAAVGVVVASAAAACSAALMPGRLPIADALDNPIGVRGAGDVLEALNTLATITAVLILIAAVARLVGRFRRAHGRERDQLKILARALPIAFVGMLAAAVASGPLNEASFYFAVAGLTAIPVAIGWAVLRHQLFGIEVLVSRALVYGSLTVVVGAMYVGIVVGLGRADRSDRPSDALVLLAVAVGALLAVTALASFDPRIRSRLPVAALSKGNALVGVVLLLAGLVVVGIALGVGD